MPAGPPSGPAVEPIQDEVEAAEPVEAIDPNNPAALPPGSSSATAVEIEEDGREAGEGMSGRRMPEEPAQYSAPPPPPKEGSLDFIRLPLNEHATDPVTDPRNIAGLYISEWDWLEPEQVQLLRQEALVLRERERH